MKGFHACAALSCMPLRRKVDHITSAIFYVARNTDVTVSSKKNLHLFAKKMGSVLDKATTLRASWLQPSCAPMSKTCV